MTDRQRAALYLGLFMALFFVVWTFRATSLYPIDEAIASPTLKALYSNLLKLLLWVLPAVAFVYWVKGLQPAKYLALSSFPGLGEWKLCLFCDRRFSSCGGHP